MNSRPNTTGAVRFSHHVMQKHVSTARRVHTGLPVDETSFKDTTVPLAVSLRGLTQVG
jgi:hypothetical protein